METVNILAIVDGFDDALLRDVTRQRQLHDKTVDIGVVVEFVDGVEQFVFGYVVLVADEGRLKSALLAGNHFVAHVCLAAAVVAHENCHQMRAAFAFGNHLFNFGCNFLFHFGSHFLTVD